VIRLFQVLETIKSEKSMTIGRICVRSTDVTVASDSVQLAARRMLDRNVGSLVVVNEDHEPIGIVTDRDLTLRVLAEGLEPATLTVGQVMSRGVHVVNETTPIEDVLRVMRSGPYRRIPVVDASGRLVGLVTLDDILDLIAEEFNSIGRLLRKESPDALVPASIAEMCR